MNSIESESGRPRIRQFIITRSALRRLHRRDVLASLRRHERGDWGHCSPDVALANDVARKDGGRLRSVYRDRRGVEFWIITEADHSTTVMLPEY
jgi:hypothetical protein